MEKGQKQATVWANFDFLSMCVIFANDRGYIRLLDTILLDKERKYRLDRSHIQYEHTGPRIGAVIATSQKHPPGMIRSEFARMFSSIKRNNFCAKFNDGDEKLYYLGSEIIYRMNI